MSIKEGLSAIASEVLGDAQGEAEATIVDAEKQAKETLQTAKQQAEQSYQSIVSQAKAQAEAEKRKILSLTEVEIRNRILKIKEEIVDAAFNKSVEKLNAFVKTKQYHDYLLRLVENSSKKIGFRYLIIHVNAKDKAWLKQGSLDNLSRKVQLEIKLSDETENFIGGCRIQTADGKILYDNTIDNRLQGLKPYLRGEVAKILFEKEV